MIILGIDIGNTTTEIAEIEDGKVLKKSFIYCVDINSINDFHKFAVSFDENIKNKYKDIVISSVFDSILVIVKQYFSLANIELMEIGKPNYNYSLKTDNLSIMGSDIIANALYIAKNSKNTKPSLCISIGTAIVAFLVVNKEINGVLITPGFSICLSKLSSFFDKIDNVAYDEQNLALMGHNTKQATTSGLFWANVGAIKEMKEAANRYSGQEIEDIYLTGGDATLFVDELPFKVIYEPDLIFKGMYLFYEENK